MNEINAYRYFFRCQRNPLIIDVAKDKTNNKEAMKIIFELSSIDKMKGTRRARKNITAIVARIFLDGNAVLFCFSQKKVRPW